MFRSKIASLIGAPMVGREKLPPGELTKGPTQRHKALMAPGLLSGVVGTLWGLGVQQR